MLRKLLSILLMLSVLWSSVSTAGACVPLDGSSGLAHAVMHWQDGDHHHHDDGALHEGDSGGAAHHVHADGAGGSAGMLSTHRLCLPTLASASPAVGAELPFPSLVPKGLLRPPRAHA